MLSLSHGWDSINDKPYNSYLLVSTATQSFAVTTTFGFDCQVKNFCILTTAKLALQFGLKSDNSGNYEYNYSSASTVYTTFGGDKPSDNIFQISRGTTSLVVDQSNMSIAWPFNAGILGLSPKSSGFFNYLMQSVDIGDEFRIGLKYKAGSGNAYYENSQMEGDITFDEYIGYEAPFMIDVTSVKHYGFPSSLFDSVDKNLDINAIYGHACIVSDMSDWFMVHQAGDAINARLAKMACEQNTIAACTAARAPKIDQIKDFKLIFYNTAITEDQHVSQEINFPASKFLRINEAGDLETKITQGTSGSMQDMYDCPIGTTIILGQKFLTMSSLQIKLVPPQTDTHDLGSYKVYFGLEDTASSIRWWIILLIILGAIIILGVIVIFVISCVKKNAAKKSDGGTGHSASGRSAQSNYAKHEDEGGERSKTLGLGDGGFGDKRNTKDNRLVTRDEPRMSLVKNENLPVRAHEE